MPHEAMPEEEVLSVDDVMERGLEKLTQVGFFLCIKLVSWSKFINEGRV